MNKTNLMQGISAYGVELSAAQIEAGAHRDHIGGFWTELGELQFSFLKSAGLRPAHQLLDVGCGCLRGGLHFVDYLETGNYSGIDVSSSLIDAAHVELKHAGLEGKEPTLIVDDGFRLERFGKEFEYMLAVSVFTHLPMNHIIQCLVGARKVLAPSGVFYTTFFESPEPAWLDEIHHQPGGIVTHYEFDPFHYAAAELEWMASIAGLSFEYLGDWDHPRNQKMAAFTVL